jgi:hypothetical protein
LRDTDIEHLLGTLVVHAERAGRDQITNSSSTFGLPIQKGVTANQAIAPASIVHLV